MTLPRALDIKYFTQISTTNSNPHGFYKPWNHLVQLYHQMKHGYQRIKLTVKSECEQHVDHWNSSDVIVAYSAKLGEYGTNIHRNGEHLKNKATHTNALPLLSRNFNLKLKLAL